MKSTFIGREKNEASFKMEFTAEDFEGAIIKAYQAGKGKYSVDGFRKGKAPRKLIEARYGEDIFYEDAINHMFSESYPKAVEELNLSPVDRPSADFDQIAAGKGFEVRVTVTVTPQVSVKDYKGVEVKKADSTVTDSDVENELIALQKKHGRMIVTEDTAKEGDTLLIDYAGYVGDEQFEGGTAERQPLTLGSNTFIPGFEEQLVGAAVGEQRDVKVTFPEEYHSADLAGKEAVFKCNVHEIKRLELPALDDDFAVEASEFETFEELKADVTEKLKKKAFDRAEYETKNSILEKVYEANEIDIPDVMVEDQIDDMMNEFNQQLQYQGLDLNQYFQFLNKDPKEFRNEVKGDAYKKVKTRLLVEAVAAAENLGASEEDIESQLSDMASQYSMDVEKLRSIMGAEARLMLERDIKSRKAIDFMFENAKFEK